MRPLDFHSYFILDDDGVIGAFHHWVELEVSEDFEVNKHLFFLDLSMLESKCSEGLFDFIKKELQQKSGKKVFQLFLSQKTLIEEFKKNTSFKIADEVHEYVVKVSDLDKDLLKKWNRPIENVSVEIIKWSDIRVLDAVGLIYTETSKDIPYQEAEGINNTYDRQFFENLLARYEARNEFLKGWLLKENGKIAAVATISHKKIDPQIFTIEYTAVKKDFRGRSYGKKIKAASTLDILTAYPTGKYFVTGTATTNLAMKHLNNMMGYESKGHVCIFKKSST